MKGLLAMKRFLYFLLFFYSSSHLIACQKKIAIVGAGLAGLTVAYRLQQQNVKNITIYEGSQRPGGRVRTCYFDNGYYEELGGMAIDEDHEELRSLVKELGLKIKDYSFPKDTTYFAQNGEMRSSFETFKAGPMPDQKLHTALVEKKDLYQNLGALLDAVFDNYADIRMVIEKYMMSEQGLETAQLATWYAEDVWQFYIDNYNEYPGETDYTLSSVDGGMSKLIEALVARVPSIQYEHMLQEIKREVEGKRLLLHFSNGQSTVADIVVLALPCTLLGQVRGIEKLFEADQLQVIKNVRYGTNAKLLIPLYAEDHHNKSVVSLGNKATDILCAKPVIWCYYGGANGIFDVTQENLKNIFQHESGCLKTLLPQTNINTVFQLIDNKNSVKFPAKGIVGISWQNEKFFKGSYIAITPNIEREYNTLMDYEGQKLRAVFRPIDEQIYFAGEHTSIDNFGYMEGALESGNMVAKMIYSKTIK